jgi:hypothetical protein
MHGAQADLPPLAELGVADTVEGLAGLALEEGDEDRIEPVELGRCDRGVPDRPAVARLDSLIAGVHSEYE